MRRIVAPEYGDASVLELQDADPDPVGPDEVRLEVRAAGVNFADVDQRSGRYQDGPEPPFVPGLEAAGVVTETGENVEEWTTGDEALCFFTDGGGYAESVVVDEFFVLPKPPSLSFTDAGGMLIQTFTAHNALHEWGRLPTGDADETVLINAAAGGVGSVATQLADIAGATVIGTASTGDKRAFARECGADHVIDYTSEDVVAAIEEFTDGEGVDLVLDGVGGNAFGDGLEALRDGGRLVTYGLASGAITTVATPRLFYRNKSVIGYHLLNGLREVPDRVLAARERIYDLVESGALSVTVEAVRPLAEAADVHRAIENRETQGRIVLEP